MADPLVFDVNETLLDMSGLDAVVDGVAGEPGVRREWFGHVLQDAFAHTLVGTPPPFGELGAAALAVVARRRGRDVADADRTALREAMSALPAHPDVRPALTALAASGTRLAVLAQAAETTLRGQLRAAGVEACFEAVVSAEAVGRFKPAPETYRAVLDALGVRRATLVAAHQWDLAGASAAGLGTVLVRRPGTVVDPSFAAPDRVIEDLRELLPAG